MKRRTLLTGAVAGAATTLAAPSIARAQQKFSWKMTNAYGPGAPFYVAGAVGVGHFPGKLLLRAGDRGRGERGGGAGDGAREECAAFHGW